MRVLVTGAAGYLGCRLVERLADRGDDVMAVDRFYFGRDGLPQHPGLAWVECDARDIPALPVDGVEAVISLAAASSEAAASAFPVEAAEIGVVARHRLALRARAAGARLFVLPSSSNVYGPSDVPLTEEAPVLALSAYSRTCWEAERHLLPLTADGFDVVVLRQATLHGWSPKMRFDLVVNNLVRCALIGEALPIAGDGSQLRPYLHVDDAVDVYLRLLGASSGQIGGRVFNVAQPGDAMSVNAITSLVCARLGDTGRRFYGSPDELSHYVSTEAVSRALGWQGRLRVADSVATPGRLLGALPAVLSDPRTSRGDWLAGLGGFG